MTDHDWYKLFVEAIDNLERMVESSSWWMFRIFFILFGLGEEEGKGDYRATGTAGGSVFIENVRRGGGSPRGPGGCLQGNGGGS